MRLVVQRVEKAKVIRMEDGKVFGSIDNGLLILVGFKKGDNRTEIDLLANKLAKLRVMSDKSGKMNLSVLDTKSKVLVVSQFTLYADTTGGNRPSFINAEDQKKAEKLYYYLLNKLRVLGVCVETGSFGDYMRIEAILDGPVTILY